MAEIVGHKDDPQQVRRVLNHFAQPGARLITLADDTAEITHEALFEHWEVLKSWLDDGRDDLRFHRQLEEAVKEWEAHKRPVGSLWRPPKLDLLRQYYERNEMEMTALQVAFLQESERKDKQTRFWKKAIAAVLVVLTLVSVIGAMWAVRSERIAQQEKRNAEIKEIEALYQTSKILQNSHDDLNALVIGVRTGIKTKQVKVTKFLKNLVAINLHELVYNIREKNQFSVYDGKVNNIIFSPDGKLLATVTSKGIQNLVDLWSIKGEKVCTLLQMTSIGYPLSFSPDNKKLAFSYEGKEIRILSILDCNEPVRLITLNVAERYSDNYITSINFNSNGEIIASGTNDGTIKLWNVLSGKEIWTFQGHQGKIRSIIFSPDGKIIASGGDDKSIKLWSVSSGSEIDTLHGHLGVIKNLDFSPDGKTLASGSDDKTIKLWNIADGREISTLHGHLDAVNSIDFSSDNKILASGSTDELIRLWDITTKKEISILEGHFAPVEKVYFSSDSKQLFSGSYDGTIKIWDFHNNKATNLRGRFFNLSHDSNMLVSGSYNEGTIKIWNVREGKEIFTFTDNLTGMINIQFTPNDKKIITTNYEGIIKLRNIKDGQRNGDFKKLYPFD